MRFSLLADHHHFFQRHGYVEFEELLSSNALATLLPLAEKGRSPGIMSIDPVDWPLVQPLCHRRLWAEIAAELLLQRPLRFGYARLLYAGMGEIDTREVTLKGLRSIQGIQEGVILGLEGKAERMILPRLAGSGMFLHADLSFSPRELILKHPAAYLLIAYAQRDAVVIANPADPFAHELRALGFSIGDRLSDETHPILVR